MFSLMGLGYHAYVTPIDITVPVDPNAPIDGDIPNEQAIPRLKGNQNGKPPIHTLNTAPHMKVDASLCGNGTIFGDSVRGGWSVCADERVLPVGQECVVYSYGLFSDW